jgi:hypothetical protein
MYFTVEVSETSKGGLPLFVSDYYARGGLGELFRGVMRGLTGAHHRTEVGSRTVSAENLSVQLTSNARSAAHFGVLSLPSALRVANKINKSGKGLRATLGLGTG